jgi:hypothetical protein
MSLSDIVQSWIKQHQAEVEKAGYCPNCWGSQEYGGQVYEAIVNQKADINTITQKQGWVQAYASEFLQGIRLQKDEAGYVCPKCKVRYKAAN